MVEKENPLAIFSQNPDDVEVEVDLDEAPAADTPPLTDGESEFERNCNKDYERWAKDARAYVRQNNDMVICIDGREGKGKSKLGLKIARDLDTDFTLEKNVLFRPTPETIEERIFQIKKYGVLMLDEAMDVLYKRSSGTSENIGINKLFARVRKFNRIVILILPDFNDLDIFFRKRRVQVRINCIDRGIGWIAIAKDYAGTSDPWFFEENNKIAMDAIGDLDVSRATPMEKLSVYEHFTGFYSPVLWKNDCVPTELWDAYEKMAMDANLKAVVKSEKSEGLNVNEKKYRHYFACLAQKYMKEKKIDAKGLHSILNKSLGIELIGLSTFEKTISAYAKVVPDKDEKIEQIDLDALDTEIEKMKTEERLERSKKRSEDGSY